MPWQTPTLRSVREMVRGEITVALGRASYVGNSVLRVMADASAALAHLVLRYIDWLAKQFLPDTAETEWLDRHGNIWLTNADGSKGRKSATYASGTIEISGILGTVIAEGTQFQYGAVLFETTEQISLAAVATPVSTRAITAGVDGNVAAGEELSPVEALAGVDSAVAVTLDGGTDVETDEELRFRVLQRIQNPPMGGDKDDYEAWALQYPGVTRAWCAPLEMGIGTVTLRFLMDNLRGDNHGLPTQDDLDAVMNYVSEKRPVAVKDFFVVAPIPYEIEFTIRDLDDDSADVRAAIESRVEEMLYRRAKPGQEIYLSWVSEAISSASGEDHHTLVFSDAAMPSPGHMAVLGSIIYA